MEEKLAASEELPQLNHLWTSYPVSINLIRVKITMQNKGIAFNSTPSFLIFDQTKLFQCVSLSSLLCVDKSLSLVFPSSVFDSSP